MPSRYYWEVSVGSVGKPTDPNQAVSWDYRAGYFPRKFALKKDAEICAADARRRGGQDVKVTKVTR